MKCGTINRAILRFIRTSIRKSLEKESDDADYTLTPIRPPRISIYIYIYIYNIIYYFLRVPGMI